MKKLFISLCLIAMTTPVMALDIPRHSPLDTNIQYTHYQNNNVVAITAFIGMATHIVFDAGETIEQVRTGFSDGWETDPVGNHLFLKPKSATGKETYLDAEGNEVIQDTVITPTPWQWKTNLLVVTNKRNYTFLLSLGSGKKGQRQNTYRLTFDYPEEVAKQKALQAEQAKLKQKLQPEILPKNWDYMMQVGKDSRNIAPTSAFDDGRFTYLSFAQNSEIPAIFIVAEDGQETLINSHINPDKPNTLVIQRIAKQFVLRLDKSVVGVTNQAFDTLSVDNQSGATVKGVKRTVKGKQS
ncbi:P-type conjugative transfer protein VirB9 [Photobacterium phosphoreum]|uniref:P-type conjugative transfer protein VirB9 n=1 Tax=Photobacterium phosphoreum TaxID=659 RepID=UPI0024B6B64E|nr:P-type conjugative transfer protein VirB9 [Photobacterium phosphoreum]